MSISQCSCNQCAPKCAPKKDRSNVISNETIAVHTVTNIILWSFAALIIGGTPGVSYSQKGLGANQDGQNQGVGSTPIWLYTPPAAFGGTYPTPAPSNWAPGTNAANVDLGGNALRESSNLCFGIASVIGATILLMRAASNTVINHPRTCKSSCNIAYFETVLLVFAWSATLAGMVSVGLGYEPKTGWAIFSVCIFSIIGFAVCYAYQVQEDECADCLQSQGQDPAQIQYAGMSLTGCCN